jgi:Catalytic LigB subunit of aromatic ring-opening dioxygenase
MAKIVAAYTVPHTPSFIAEVAQNGAASPTAGFFATIKAHLDEINPDLLILIQNDHFNTFFLDNWPTFALGVAERTCGPSDQTPEMPQYEVTIAQPLARHLLSSLVENDFDFSASQEFDVDHAVLVPLHFLTPTMAVPIVPVFINCLVPPLPSARRCYRLGSTIKTAVERWPQPIRVAVIASGSLSLEVGGPLIEPGKTFGVPDPEWASWILDMLRSCRHNELVAAATSERMAQAGNVGGELLNWIGLLGITGRRAPEILINQPELGNAFAAWTLAKRGEV